MNERDSEQVAQMLVARGHVLTSHEEEADVVLLNTCSVRDLAEQKALGKMGMLGALSRQRSIVYGFLGCMAQSRGESLLRSAPHVNLVVGTQKFHRVAEYVDQALSQQAARRLDFGETWTSSVDSVSRADDLRFSIVDVDAEAGSQNSIRDHSLTPAHVTSFVSIIDRKSVV